jgi:hypothetical protein
MKTRANTVESIAERLRDEEQTARRYLDMCGLSVRDVRYADNFNLEFLYSLFNRRTSRNTKLPESVFDMTGQVCGVPDGEFENYLWEEENADGEG